jgi:hypothetical protein
VKYRVQYAPDDAHLYFSIFLLFLAAMRIFDSVKLLSTLWSPMRVEVGPGLQCSIC